MSKLAESLSALFAGYAEFWLGVSHPVPPFRVARSGPDLELTVEAYGGEHRVTGRLSAYPILAHRFWSAVLPPPIVIPSLIREGTAGRHWGQFDDEYAATPVRAAAACLETAGERTEAVLVHRLLSSTDDDLGVPPWTSAEDYTGHHLVPKSLLAEVARRSQVVDRLAGRESWNAAVTVKALLAGTGVTDPVDRLSLARLFAWVIDEWMWSEGLKHDDSLRPLLSLTADPSAVGLVALGAAEQMGLALFQMRAYAEAIPWLTAGIGAELRVAELSAARWECRLAVGDPDAEADWVLAERTHRAPDAQRSRAGELAGGEAYWTDVRFAGSLDARRAAGLARAAEAAAMRSVGADLWLADRVRRYGPETARRGIERLIKRRACTPDTEEAAALRTRAWQLVEQALQTAGPSAADTTPTGVNGGSDRDRFFRASALFGSVGRARETLGDLDGALAAYTTARDFALACGVPGDWWSSDVRRTANLAR